jgi:hypothetical protein
MHHVLAPLIPLPWGGNSLIKGTTVKKLALTVIAASLAFATPAFAEDAHHPEKTQEKAQGAPAKPAAPVKKMQDNVKKMQSQLDRISKAKDDSERQKLMAEHMQTMHENMMTAKGMMGDGMGCSMMKDGMGMGGMGGKGMAPSEGGPGADQTMQRMQQMEKRMDMMQMMMQQMQKPAAPPR